MVVSNPDRVDKVQAGPLTVTASTGRVQSLFERAPHKVFFHMRDTLGAIFGSHRRAWLEKAEIEFHRGGLKAAAFGSRAGADKGGIFLHDKKFFYIVDPRRKSVPRSEQPDLEQITATAFTFSKVALGLEEGGTYTPSGGGLKRGGTQFMAIPIGYAIAKSGRPKAGFSSPFALQRHPQLKHKGTTVRKKPGQAPIMYLKKELKTKTKYLPIFLLVESIRRKPRLKFMDTWDALESDRDRRFSKALTRIVEELEAGR